jgi:hypothetical protein
MEETEKLIVEQISMKINSSITNYEKLQKEDIVSQHINSTKTDELKYIKYLNEANNLIDNANLQEKELYQFYQEKDKFVLDKIKNNYCGLLIYIKETNSKIINDIDSKVKQFIKIDIKSEINSFIEKNKSNSLQSKKIEFIPYEPFSSLKDSLKSTNENALMNTNYEVIQTLRKEFKHLCNNLDMELEKKRKNFRLLCLSLFDEEKSNFTKENQNQLINYIKSREYRDYFIKTLTNQRINGRFKRKEKLFNEILEILKFILDLAEEEKNFEDAKNCIILSQTFYKEVDIDDETAQKHYLMEYIKKHKWLSKISFWEECIENDIIKDQKKT